MLFDPLEQALAQLRAITAQSNHIEMPEEYAGREIQMPEEPIESAAGQLYTPAPLPMGQGFSQLPSEVERKEVLAQDGFMQELAPPAPSQDFGVPDPTPPDPATLWERTADVSAEAPFKPLNPSASADESLARAARAKYAAEVKRAEAEKSRLTDVADAMQRGADEQADLTMTHQRAMAAANAQADMETANWMTSMTEQAKQEPNPDRWWDSRSGLGKALWALSMVFGSAKVAITPGAKNLAMEMVQEEIARDIQLQQARLKQEMAVTELRGTVMRDRQARNRTDQADIYSQNLGRIQSLQRVWEAKAQVPGQLDDEALKLEASAWFLGKQAEVSEQYRQERAQSKAASITRGFQARQAELLAKAKKEEADLDRQHQSTEKALDRQLTRDMGMISVGAKGPKVNAKGMPVDDSGIPLYRVPLSGVKSGATTNAVLVGHDGRPVRGTGEVYFRKEDADNFKSFGEITTGANKHYQALARVDAILADPERIKTLVMGNTDAELQSLLTTLGTEQAKKDDPGGRYTNQDFSRGLQASMGFDANGNWLERGKFAANIDDIRGNLQKRMKSMQTQVNQQLTPLIETTINEQGARVVWGPVDLSTKEPQQRSQDEIEGTTSTPEPVKNIKDYRSRAETEAKEGAKRGQLLPDHDRDVVETVMTLGRDKDGKIARGPDSISKQATDILNQLNKQEEAIKARTSEAPETIWDRAGEPRGEMTDKEKKAIERLQNTKALVKTLADEEIAAAAEKMHRIEGDIKVWSMFKNDDQVRKEVGRRHGMKGAPREIEELIKKARKLGPTPLDFLPRKD